MSDNANEESGAEKSAREYAWEWFKYHAGQRQTVFRFYLVIVGAISAGYIATNHSGVSAQLSAIFGFLLIITSLLFWRLDVRGRKLVKLAEAYLKIGENKLSNLTGHQEIQLAAKADEKELGSVILSKASSFGQIYRIIFFTVSIIGFIIVIL